ncbi:MAG TPA: hypothetical protein VGQ36_13830 [Thermoanaerobaculia bacterium]|jgi:hypothetical protein|nr:hypothetical protein [Thermoanaerobaculia bacterium]
MTCKRVLRTIAVVLFLLTVRSASAGYLQFLLSSELAKNHGPVAPHTSFNGVCSGDADGDCLDDAVENELIQKVNPSYFLDEDESCSRMYVYAQVRPVGHGVDVWRVDGRVKRVNVTYFYLYEEDCQSYVGFAGHNGDSEHVRFFLSSLDLKTWTLDHGIYWRHSGNKDVTGIHINNIATDIKGVVGQAVNVPPIVASDQNGHGSWEGFSAYSSACSFSGSDIRDCFDKDQARYSRSSRPAILHNIGGPSLGRQRGPERWRTGTPHLTVSGSEVYTLRNTVREYWMPRRDFCGWRCLPGIPCSSCTGSLEGKLDQEEFSRQSRPVTPEENGAPYQYQCKFTRDGGPEVDNFGTWTYRGQNPQGHLLYTVVDKAATHYYRLWYSKQIGPKSERWILEWVAPNNWQGQALGRCDFFDVSLAGSLVEFSGPTGACSNGVKQTCYGPAGPP